MVIAFSVNGGVNFGLVGPYNASNGVLTAAATCINPESLVKTKSKKDRTSIASRREVSPVKSTKFSLLLFISCLISSASFLSFLEPKSMTCHPFERYLLATSAK